MVRAGSSPGVQRLASARVWFLPVAMAVCTIIAVSVSSAGRTAVAVCGIVATVAVAVIGAETARRGRAMAAMRQQFAEQDAALKQRLAQQEAEMVRLGRELLPQAVSKLQHGEQVDEALAAVLGNAGHSSNFVNVQRGVLRAVLEAVSAEEGLRDSAQRAFVNIARRVQAIVHQQSTDMREMEDRHGTDSEVFGDLLHLDHGTALIGRLADSIAVMGGARPGRQWMRNVPLFSVLRGAMSRILDYQRVELHSVAEVAVVGPAVEPLIHALAELLDNATRYSPPQTRVHLTAVDVQAGVAIEIEDGGVGLSDEARIRAERVLKQASTGLDLADLGETPRLGLAVVGRLAQANNFQVSLRPSAYGGVRVVLVVPRDLITAAPAPTAVPSVGPLPGITLPRPKPSSSGGGEAEEESVVGVRNSGLPQRRRRGGAGALPNRAAAQSNDRAAGPAAPVPSAPAAGSPADPDPVQPGMWLEAFHKGISGEGEASTAVSVHGDEPSGEGE
jgi:signal transduction histidine kinase